VSGLLYDPFGRPISSDDIDDLFEDAEELCKTVDNLFDNITKRRVPCCECGSEKTYGKNTNLHAFYCPLYRKK
jgi:hypothetical protein